MSSLMAVFSRTAGLKKGLFAFFLVLLIEKEKNLQCFFAKTNLTCCWFHVEAAGPSRQCRVGSHRPLWPAQKEGGGHGIADLKQD